MTDAADPGSRRTLLVRRLMERRGQRDELVVCAGERSEPANNASGEAESRAGDPAESRDERRLRYGDRQLTLFLDATERDRLDELLDEYPVFKLDAPATRKSEDGTVYVSAVADPKHLADFIEDCCRQVYDLPTGYALSVE